MKDYASSIPADIFGIFGSKYLRTSVGIKVVIAPVDEMYLSLLEQSPRTRSLYTQLCFCFTTRDDVHPDTVTQTLDDGLKRLTASFPWVAGQVVHTAADDNDPYVFQVEPLADLPQLIVLDHTTDKTVPNMASMTDTHFPYSMLDEKLFCSRSTLSEWPTEKSTFPVLSLQANFINGGFLLTVQACHIVLDIVGEAQIIGLFSAACHGDALPAEAVSSGNSDRRNIVPLLDGQEEREEPANATKETISATTAAKELEDSHPEDLVWSYFAFTPESLTKLKTTAQTDFKDPGAFVSTDDSVSALIWQSIARSRLHRLAPSDTLTFIRQVDVRRYMNVPDTYLGNMVSQTNSILTLQQLSETNVGTLAGVLRQELDAEDLRRKVQTQATEQANGLKKAAISKDRAGTVTMSSWSKVDLCNVDFNLGFGKPIAVRRPGFTPIEGLVYLLPKAVDGEIAAGLCLRSKDTDWLRQDQEFSRYAKYIG